MQNKVGAPACRLNILLEIGKVNTAPNIACRIDGFGLGQFSITMKIRAGFAEGGFLERQKARHIPLFNNIGMGVDIDREIKKIGDRRRLLARAAANRGLENIQTLDNQNIGLADADFFIRQNIIGNMRIDRRTGLRRAGFHGRQKIQQIFEVKRFRKAFALHQAALLQHGIWKQKPVRRYQIDLWMRRPARQHFAQNA